MLTPEGAAALPMLTADRRYVRHFSCRSTAAAAGCLDHLFSPRRRWRRLQTHGAGDPLHTHATAVCGQWSTTRADRRPDGVGWPLPHNAGHAPYVGVCCIVVLTWMLPLGDSSLNLAMMGRSSDLTFVRADLRVG